MAQDNNTIDYIEFPGRDLPAVKAFYGAAFGWKFTDYGPEYVSFDRAGTDGGFTADGSLSAPLVILYAADLEAAQGRVEAAGGKISRAIFSFPGGRRFHFTDPAGNELAVWAMS